MARVAERVLTVEWWIEDRMSRLPSSERGQSMVEYAVVVALVAIIAMAGVQAFGQGITQVFQQMLSHIQGLGS